MAHPELSAERARLAATRDALQRAIARPLRRTGGGDEDAAIALEVQRVWYREQLQEALDAPYFGRVDFQPQGAPVCETYYVGKTYFEGDGLTVTGDLAPNVGILGVDGDLAHG